MSGPDFIELRYITINLDGKNVKVQACDYIEAKTKDLIAFGYTTLTEKQVTNSLRRILNKEKLVDVIDHFMKDDIVLEDEK